MMSFKDFKKVSEDKNTVTMGHPKGHLITIHKGSLPALQRKQLDRIPLHLASGGTASDDAESTGDDAPPAVSQDVSSDDAPKRLPTIIQNALAPGDHPEVTRNALGVPTGIVGQALSPDANSSLPEASKDLPDMGQSTGSAPDANRAPAVVTPQGAASGKGFDLNKSYQQGQNAISEQQDVATQLAEKQVDIQEKDLLERQSLNETVQKNAADFQKHQTNLLADYAKGHINPNAYQESMGVGQKVATAIGLLLGGFSGGFNKTGVNPAADFLNKQIDRDIESQKADIDKRKTLLGANQELYKDQVLATNATRMNMNDIYDHKIQLAADQLGTPAARAVADREHAKFALENSNLLQQNAIRSGVTSAIQHGGGGLDPLTLSRAGYMSSEQADKEAASIDRQKSAIQSLRDLYGQAQKEAKLVNIANPASGTRLANLNAAIGDAILGTDTNHRVSPETKKAFLDPYLISTRDAAQGTAPFKLNQALSKVKEFSAGTTPITQRLAPGALPEYGTASPMPQHKVGDTIFIKGQKAQITNAKGDYQFVK